ncbi:FkbM family methyltransferase, partial [Magnetococcales bacterium HHB-1]
EQGHHYYPVALHKDQQERPFYITRFDASCGFYPYRTEVWKRFLDYQNTEIIDQIMLTTQGLDQFYQEQKIAPADFIKLDVEGAEWDVLHGGKESLASALGVCFETYFKDVAKQPVFSKIDQLLSPLGFELFDLELKRFSRRVLPQVSPYRDSQGNRIPGPGYRGQVLSADALYFRDAIQEIKQGKRAFWQQEERLLKLAALYEIYGLYDCTIELLLFAEKEQLLPKTLQSHYLIDLATPPPLKEKIKPINAIWNAITTMKMNIKRPVSNCCGVVFVYGFTNTSPPQWSPN